MEFETYEKQKAYERVGISRNAWKRRRRAIKGAMPHPIQRADVRIEGCGATLFVSETMMAEPRNADEKDKQWRRRMRDKNGRV